MSNHNETLNATMIAATAAIDARARQCGIDFLTSSRKVPADLRDCIAGWSGKPWVTAKTLSQSELTEHVMRFLVLARRAWEDNPLDRQSMDLWADFGKRVASGLKTSTLDGCAILCRARADSEAAMGKKLPKSGSILGYDCWGRANDSTESGNKSRWLEIQVNSPKESADITDSIPNVLNQAIEPDLSNRDDINRQVRLTEARTIGTQTEREPVIRLDAETEHRLNQKVMSRDDRIEQLGLDLALASAELDDALTMLAIVRRERDELLGARHALLARIAAMSAALQAAKPRKPRKTTA